MNIKVNGRDDVQLDDDSSVMDLLTRLGVKPETVAVELDGDIISNSDFAKTLLKSGDQLEIVSFVGGG